VTHAGAVVAIWLQPRGSRNQISVAGWSAAAVRERLLADTRR
jgi:hypothetical protein